MASLIEGTNGILYGTTQSGGKNNQGTVYRIYRDATGYAVLHNFAFDGVDGMSPTAPVIQGSDGALYGTTESGGSSNFGTVFRLKPDGGQYQVLHHFTGEATGDGAAPVSALVEAGNRMLYGTTSLGGSNDLGTIFKLGKDGNGFAVIHHFTGGLDGDGPKGSLIVGTDGWLYGTTLYGGAEEYGTVFKVDTNGGSFSVLHSFNGATASDGAYPSAGLLEGSDGALYGTTQSGGTTDDRGTVFKVNKNSSGYSVLYRFTGTAGDGADPRGGLVEGSDGGLYGTTSSGGTANRGLVFKLSKNGTGFQALHHFTTGGGDGSAPGSSLLKASDGLLYGPTSGGGSFSAGTLFRLSQAGQDYSVMLAFTAGGGDGFRPQSSLLRGTDGRFYGTTSSGGNQNRGTVFTVKSDGSGHNVLHTFGGAPGDGAEANGDLVEALDGWLYGTTYLGGFSNRGTVFKLAKDGIGYTLVRQFTGTTSDGGNPQGGVIDGGDGWLYGTAYSGGLSNRGALFKLGRNGTGFALLYSFVGGTSDGRNPRGGLVEGSNGALFGTTEFGGSAGGFSDRGTVFKISKAGSGYQVLHHFSGAVVTPVDGRNPRATLLRASDERLYGTTYAGGVSNVGTVFVLNQNGGGYELLHSFTGTLGASPRGKLVEGTNGVLYGMTYAGGNSNLGTLYHLGKNGSGFTLVHHFTDSPWGQPSLPQAGLTVGGDGALFGTTYGGGSMNLGAVFKLTSDGDSLFNRIVNLQAAASQVLVLSRGVPGRTYALYRSEDLQQWSALGSLTAPPDGLMEFRDAPPPSAAAFYRVRQQ